MRSLLLAAVSAAVLLAACTPPPPAPPVTRLAVRLADPRDGATVPRPDVSRGKVVDLSVELPEGPWMEQATLRLEGLIGRAWVTLDDGAPVELIGGPGYTDLPLPGLAAGVHRFRVESGPAPDLSPVLIGGDGPRSPSLMDPPLLLLRPAAHVEALSLPVTDGKVEGRAQVAGAPEGARVRFVVSQDGEVLQELGTAPVVAGEARTGPQRWRQGTWALGRPALYTVHALLEDGSGRVLDAFGMRTGVRAVTLTERGFLIGGGEARLLATRSGPASSPPQVVQDALGVGANAVEFHGTPPTRGQLEALDEVGLAAILTHRCDGAFRRVLRNEEIGVHTSLHEQALAGQDRRLSWAMGRHPSVVLWVTEAVAFPRLAQLMVEADPQRRPVVGADLPLMTVMDGVGRQGRSYAGSFVVESAWNGPPGASADLAAAYLAALGQGGRGGVIEHNRDPERLQAWTEALATAGERRVDTDGRRAATRVDLAGAPPRQVAWLEGPWLAAEAAVVDDRGHAALSTWYQGPASLRVGSSTTPVELRAGQWREGGQRSDAQAVGMAAGATP